MPAFSDHATSRSAAALGRVPISDPTRCRCGTRLVPGQEGLRFVRIAPVAEGILRGRTYCGYACARADLLESVEEVDHDAVDALLRDREELLAELRRLLVLVEHEWFDSKLDRAQQLASRARSDLLDGPSPAPGR